MTEHRIRTEYEGERAYWYCSCSAAGSCHESIVDLASHRHIADGESRVDVSGGESS